MCNFHCYSPYAYKYIVVTVIHYIHYSLSSQLREAPSATLLLSVCLLLHIPPPPPVLPPDTLWYVYCTPLNLLLIRFLSHCLLPASEPVICNFLSSLFLACHPATHFLLSYQLVSLYLIFLFSTDISHLDGHSPIHPFLSLSYTTALMSLPPYRNVTFLYTCTQNKKHKSTSQPTNSPCEINLAITATSY